MGARSDSWPASKYPITLYAAELFPNMFPSAFCDRNCSMDQNLAESLAGDVDEINEQT
jgi:hypothetical protein